MIESLKHWSRWSKRRRKSASGAILKSGGRMTLADDSAALLEERLAPAADVSIAASVDGHIAGGVLNATGTEVRLDFSSADRGVLEFDISAIPSTALVTSASLTGRATLLQYNSNQNRVTTTVAAYAGDGVLSVSDGAAAGTAFAGSYSTSTVGTFSIPLSTSVIRSFLGRSYLGLQLAKTQGERMFIASTEGFFAEKPTLRLQYTHVPIAQPDSYSVNEDGSLTVSGPGLLANDSDADGDPIRVASNSFPSNGTVAVNANGSFTYTPKPNFHGVDTFTYNITDGAAFSAVVPVTVTVAPVPDAPDARDDGFVTAEDTPLLVNSTGSSFNPLLKLGFDESSSGASPALNAGSAPIASLSFAGQATRTSQTPGGAGAGALDLTGGNATGNYLTSGGDVQAFDTLQAMTITAWVNMRGAPSYNELILSDRPAGVQIGQGWELKFDRPWTNNNPASADNYAVTFGIYQGGGTSSTTQGAGIEVVNRGEDWVFVAMTYNNADGYFYRVIADAATPVLSMGFATIFSYRLGDNSAPLLVGGDPEGFGGLDRTPPAWLDDIRVYDSILSVNQIESVRRENLAKGVLANDADPDGDVLSAVLVDSPAHGEVVLNPDGTFTYTPDADYNGPDSFTYRAFDGALTSNLATVRLSVTPVADPPSAGDDAYALDEGSILTVTPALGVLGNDSDPDGDALSAILVSGPSRGSLALNPDGSFRYQPDPNFFGTDSFSYKASDGALQSGVAVVSLTVRPINSAPTLAPIADATVNEAGLLSIATSADDVDGDALTFSLDAGAPSGMAIHPTTGLLTWTPTDGPGSFAVTVRVTDDGSPSLSASQTFAITVGNVRPTASAIVPATGVRGQARELRFGASDPSSVDQAAGFTFAVNWGDGSPIQTVVPGAPLTLSRAYASSGAYTITVAATDKDGGVSDPVTRSIVISAAELQDDPLSATGGKVLAVGGTLSADAINLTIPKKQSQIDVAIAGVSVGRFQPAAFDRIVIFGQSGNDNITIASSISKTSWIYGGDGADNLSGGGGNNLLFGGPGNDSLTGGGARDLLVGGVGSDLLEGVAGGDDILIAGTTSFDGNDAAFQAILAEWNSVRSLAVRQSNLTNGSGSANRLNGAFFLVPGTTIFDDADIDTLNGTQDSDWAFYDRTRDRLNLRRR